MGERDFDWVDFGRGCDVRQDIWALRRVATTLQALCRSLVGPGNERALATRAVALGRAVRVGAVARALAADPIAIGHDPR